MQARIFQPARSAMTSGQGNSKTWVLEFTPGDAQRIDPLMGWTGSSGTRHQVRLGFSTREAAVEYAERHALAYQIEEPKRRRANIRPQGYAGNFAHNRRGNWTH